jgi:hypothetical protein
VSIEYHPAVEQDVSEALERYDAVSQKLGEEFKAELRRMISLAAANPGRFHHIKAGFHRVNLHRFPYHFIYREITNGIRITLVRHHHRNPDFGIARQ